jgi:hypothetical protein
MQANWHVKTAIKALFRWPLLATALGSVQVGQLTARGLPCTFSWRDSFKNLASLNDGLCE